jgi:hypothetical protein
MFGNVCVPGVFHDATAAPMEFLPQAFTKQFPLRRLQHVIHEPSLKGDLSHCEEIVHGHVSLVFPMVHFDAFDSCLSECTLQMSSIREPFLPGQRLAKSEIEFLFADE